MFTFHTVSWHLFWIYCQYVGVCLCVYVCYWLLFCTVSCWLQRT